MTNLFDELRSRNPLPEVVKPYAKGWRSTSDGFQCKCPIHNEVNGAAFDIYRHKTRGHWVWKCKGKCNATGDVVDFLMAMEGISRDDAIQRLGGLPPKPSCSTPRSTPETATLHSAAASSPLTFVPFRNPLERADRVRAFNPKKNRITSARPVGWYEYFNTDGELLGIVVREESENGKFFRTLQMTAEHGLTWANFAKPAPLYGLDRLKPDTKLVVLVEGEGKADALQAVSPKAMAVLGLYQGASSAHLVDYSPLMGREFEVRLWPDNDEAGRKAMARAAELLQGLKLTTVTPEPDRPEGWDAADLVAELGDRQAVMDWMKTHKGEKPEPVEEPATVTRLDDRRPKPHAQLVHSRQERPDEADEMGVIEEEFAPLDRKPSIQDVARRTRKNRSKDGAETAAPDLEYNWRVFLHYHPDMWDVFGRNSFDGRTYLVNRPPWYRSRQEWKPIPFSENELTRLISWMGSVGLKPKRAPLLQLVIMHAEWTREFNPVLDYLKDAREQWDGVPRLDTWLQVFCGAADKPAIQKMGAMWMIGAVARVMDPGVKMDTMLILEGPQGAGKSSVFKILATAVGSRDYFNDNLEDLSPLNVAAVMQSTWIAEVSEMAAFSQKDSSVLKKFISKERDTYRMHHTHDSESKDRKFVLCGTINPDGSPYLKDPTGARRMLPVAVGKIDIEGLKANVHQLWGEAVARFEEGEKWYAEKGSEIEGLIEAEQAARTSSDVWEARVIQILHKELATEEVVYAYQILALLNVQGDRQNEMNETRIGRIMSRLKWQRTRPVIGGTQVRAYRRPR